MPSKEPAKGLKPHIVFYVAAATPEDIHADTILARSAEGARAIADEQHADSKILHVRGVGDDTCESPVLPEMVTHPILPGARFINGRFLASTMSDDPVLDTINE